MFSWLEIHQSTLLDKCWRVKWNPAYPALRFSQQVDSSVYPVKQELNLVHEINWIMT